MSLKFLFIALIVIGCVACTAQPPPSTVEKPKVLTPVLTPLEYAKLREMDRIGRYDRTVAFCREAYYVKEIFAYLRGRGHLPPEQIWSIMSEHVKEYASTAGEDGLPKCTIIMRGDAGFNYIELVFFEYIGGDKAAQVWEIKWTGGGTAYIGEILTVSVV